MPKVLVLAWVLLGPGLVRCDDQIRYVSLQGSSQAPYTNWAMAATNLADCIDVTPDGGVVNVSSGRYAATRNISISSKTMMITSVYGAAETIYDGGGQKLDGIKAGAASLIYVHGMTFTNFNDTTTTANCYALCTAGVGTLCLGSCVIAGNAGYNGGGIYLGSGGVLHATNCVIKGNTGLRNGMGGGALSCIYADEITLDKCEFIGNESTGSGGGIQGGAGLIARNCLFSGNVAAAEGGGVNVYNGTNCLLENCIIVSNSCGYYGGAGVGIRSVASARIRNCLIAHNTSFWRGGGVYITGSMLMENCTVVSNTSGTGGANGVGGGVCCYGSETSINSIVYFNVSPQGLSNYHASVALDCFWEYCCTAPDPGAAISTNCITADPLFVDSANGYYRLSKVSPCINTGTNQDWMIPPNSGSVDPDGMSRIDKWYRRVDIGAYEYLAKGSAFVAF